MVSPFSVLMLLAAALLIEFYLHCITHCFFINEVRDTEKITLAWEILVK